MVKMRLALFGCLLALVACGKDSPTAPTPTPTPPPAPTTSVLSVAVTPSPIVATGSGPYTASFTVTVTETGGMTANINNLNCTLRNSTTGVEVGTLSWNPVDITQRAGSNTVLANGKLAIPLGVIYVLSYGGRQATLTVVVQAADSAGHQFNLTATVPVV